MDFGAIRGKLLSERLHLPSQISTVGIIFSLKGNKLLIVTCLLPITQDTEIVNSIVF